MNEHKSPCGVIGCGICDKHPWLTKNEPNTNDWEERFYDFASDSLVCFISDGEGGENNLYLNNAECLEELKDFIRKELALAEARGEARGAERVIEKLNSWEPVD